MLSASEREEEKLRNHFTDRNFYGVKGSRLGNSTLIPYVIRWKGFKCCTRAHARICNVAVGVGNA